MPWFSGVHDVLHAVSFRCSRCSACCSFQVFAVFCMLWFSSVHGALHAVVFRCSRCSACCVFQMFTMFCMLSVCGVHGVLRAVVFSCSRCAARRSALCAVPTCCTPDGSSVASASARGWRTCWWCPCPTPCYTRSCAPASYPVPGSR